MDKPLLVPSHNMEIILPPEVQILWCFYGTPTGLTVVRKI